MSPVGSSHLDTGNASVPVIARQVLDLLAEDRGEEDESELRRQRKLQDHAKWARENGGGRSATNSYEVYVNRAVCSC